MTVDRWRSTREIRARGCEGEQGVAILTALLFMVLASGLSLVLLSAILAQSVPAANAQRNTRTIYSAQAGLQDALNVIRSVDKTYAGESYGDRTRLPCTLTGNVAGDPSGASYRVAVSYYNGDPTVPTSAVLPCTSSGTSKTPRYALITSTGQDTAIAVSGRPKGSRTVSGTYQFRLKNLNIPGGKIFATLMLNNGTAAERRTPFCWTAWSTAHPSQKTPPLDSVNKVKFSQTCNTPEMEPYQNWIYGADHQLKLAQTTHDGQPGRCLVGPDPTATDPLEAKIEPCAPADSPEVGNQLWSWGSGQKWSGPRLKTPAAGVDNYCLTLASFKDDALNKYNLRVTRACPTHGDDVSFNPQVSVGAGSASYKSGQLVNFLEFGRCADVTGSKIDSSFMISYPCKQKLENIPGSEIEWNHLWSYSEPTAGARTALTTITVNKGSKWCLTMPSRPGYVTFKSCTNTASQKWLRVGDSGRYADSFVFKDSATGKLCLTADVNGVTGERYQPAAFAGSSVRFSKLTVAKCVPGDLSQKWNAPAEVVDAKFGGFSEEAG
ncbi:hypothetical protein GCM10027056_11040 [Glaciibacter psychrotolerans]